MSYKEQLNTYMVFAKSSQPGFNTVKIKAASVAVSDEDKTVVFESGGKRVAQFNLAEIIGFANAENIG